MENKTLTPKEMKDFIQYQIDKLKKEKDKISEKISVLEEEKKKYTTPRKSKNS